jgi:hypothetical protein
MSFQDHASNILDNLIAAAIWSWAILKGLPWVARLLRSRRSTGKVHMVSLTESITITPKTGALVINAPAEPMPPGTASAIGMAAQALPQPTISKASLTLGMNPNIFAPSRLVNNSMMMQFEAAQRHHDIAAHSAMQSTMPKCNHAR